MVRDTLDARILVVDDIEVNARVLAGILARAGYRDVSMWTDPAAALDAVMQAPPDLVLLDIHMPGVDGHAFLATVRAALPEDAFLPIIVVTADVMPETRRRALEAGANDFLTKPVDVTEVMLRVRNHLHTRSLHQALLERASDLANDVLEHAAALEHEQQDRLDVALALASPHPGDTTELAATSLCTDLVERRGLSAATIVAFDSATDTTIVASAGVRTRPVHDASAAWTRRLRERAAQGPWVEAGDATPSPDASALVVAVPLHTGMELVGVLVGELPGSAGEGRARALLPTLLDYAAVVSAMVGPRTLESRAQEARRGALLEIIAQRQFHPVYQPIVELRSGTVVGFEALTRFSDGHRPDERFAEAAALGESATLEIACIERAVAEAKSLPPGTFLSINASPGLLDPRGPLPAALAGADREIVLEVTETAPIDDYEAFRIAVAALDRRLAVDDAGAGYSSLRHIVELRPAFMKIDMSLVRDVDTDPSRQALIVALDHFALRAGLTLIAEGIETETERAVLADLGIELGQGYLLGKPQPAAALIGS